MGNNRIRGWFNRKLWGVPLYVVCLSGLVGMAVDAMAKPLSYYFPETFGGRFLHIPLLASAVIIILYCCARATGLLIKLVLKKLKGGKHGRD